MTKCLVNGCGDPSHSHGMCAKHYQRFKRTGKFDLPERVERPCASDGCDNIVKKDGGFCHICRKRNARRDKKLNKKEKIFRRMSLDKQKELIDTYGIIKICGCESSENVPGDKTKCSVYGCDRPSKNKGLCTKHYQRNKKYGRPITEETVILDMSLKEKILFKSLKNTENSCWEWNGRKDMDGYGVLSINDANYRAHRVSFEQFVRPIPPGQCICHSCDNPSCVNPGHLFLGTISDNNKDRYNKGRVPKGEDNPATILTEEQVIEIKRLLKDGKMTGTAIANKYGVTSWTISRIKCGKNWKHIE